MNEDDRFELLLKQAKPIANEAETEEGETEITEYDVLELLEYLKDALLFLPEEDQIKYRKSDERMLMDVMRKLSGKLGLHEKSVAKSAALEKSESSRNSLADLSETLSLLANLSAELPDKDFADILGKRTGIVQERLKSLKDESH